MSLSDVIVLPVLTSCSSLARRPETRNSEYTSHLPRSLLKTDLCTHPSSRYEAYDRVEGQAAIAERTAELSNKDDLTRKERKEIDAEKQHQLAMRHRGVMQYQPARTGKWTKEGLKRRMGSVKAKIMGNGEKDRGQVESEA